MLLFIIANALILKHVLTEEQIPQTIAGAMLEAGFGPVMFLVIVNLILLDRRPVHGALGPHRHRRASGLPHRHRAWASIPFTWASSWW